MSLQCECGYDLRELTGDRCPECGSTVTRHGSQSRCNRYLLGGFLIGFGIVAVPTVLDVPWYFAAVEHTKKVGESKLGPTEDWILLVIGVELAIAVVTGLIGMLTGYGVYKLKASSTAWIVVALAAGIVTTISVLLSRIIQP